MEAAFELNNEVNLAALIGHSDCLQVDQEASSFYFISIVVNLNNRIRLELDTRFFQATVNLAA